MEDGSKSTDSANAGLFKEKKTKVAASAATAATEEEEDLALKPKRGLSSYMFFSNEYTKMLRDKSDGT